MWRDRINGEISETVTERKSCEGCGNNAEKKTEKRKICLIKDDEGTAKTLVIADNYTTILYITE